ncbi:MAG: hypothetical protein RL748_316 [Pseudomonadota bacterium]
MIFANGIFFTTILVSFLTLMLVTLIGSRIGHCLPWRLRPISQFYLAPVLGLSVLALVASWIGRSMAFGQGYWPTLVMLVLVLLLLWRDPGRMQSLKNAAGIGLFGLICGAGILMPLFLGGGYDSHNDSFTNLAQAMWLQDHAFSDTINQSRIQPYATQILLYQQAGFRMGGSYLLALMQAMFHQKWSYDVFPALLIVAITSCCMSLGMVLARTLRPLRRSIRFALLALPSFCIGGLTYGAYYGFMAQTVGLALGAGALFLCGHLLLRLGCGNFGRIRLAMATVPLTLLLSAAVVAYSELAPFWCLTLLTTGVMLAWKTGGYGNIAWASLCVMVLSCLMLNSEILRAYMALRLQAGVVVGSPVDWPLIGFVAHGLGIHGGAWGGLQWANGRGFWVGCMLLIVLLLLLARNAGMLWQQTRRGEMLPVMLVLALFLLALLYFRYGVISPFPVGKGQSWSQAKLMDWAFPFSAALILAGISNWRIRSDKWMVLGVSTMFAIGLISVLAYGAVRIHSFKAGFAGVTNLRHFYLEIRAAVQRTCSANQPVHLATGPDHMKFRETLTLYLYDRELTSDWRNDVYLNLIPPEPRNLLPSSGSCFFEPRNRLDVGRAGRLTEVGQWQVRNSKAQGH